jgi:tetratricopeptide (TPR) repeat protein
MVSRAWQLAFLLLLLSGGALGQALITPPSRYEAIAGSLAATGLTSPGQATFDLWTIGNAPKSRSPLQSPSGSVSKLDLKAPEKARKEYGKGYELLMRKDLRGALEHLTSAISMYPQFVGAHSALGSAYLQLGQNDLARDQFSQAVLLDDHLPLSYLNLGSAQLALKDYRSAEDSVGKASSIAPLDLQPATVLTYTQLMNQDYGAVLATARQVHSRKHEGAAMVHYFAAAAWQDQNNLQGTEDELETFLREDPKPPGAEQARLVLRQIKANPIPTAAMGGEGKKKTAAPPFASSSVVHSVRVGVPWSVPMP